MNVVSECPAGQYYLMPMVLWTLFQNVQLVSTTRVVCLWNVWRMCFLRSGYVHVFFTKSRLFFGGHTCPVLGPLIPLFWISGDFSSGFLTYSFFAEVNVMYIPWDPPLVLHMWTSWWLALQRVLSPHTVVVVRLSGFELVLSEYLWVRRSTNWAKPGPTIWVSFSHHLSASLGDWQRRTSGLIPLIAIPSSE